ncbi:MAG: hypothetical protein ABI717_06990 [Actinomycetota bacterium]
MRRLFLCCAVLVVALIPLACGADETSSTTSAAPSISTPTSTGGDAAALVSTLKASNSTCATVQLYATASIAGGLAAGKESGATNDLLMLFSPALSTLTADAAANPADGAPEVVTSAIDRLNTVFSGVVDEMRAAGLTDEQYETLTTVAVEILQNGVGGDTPDDPELDAVRAELKAVLDQVATDVAAAAEAALGEGQDDSKAEAWFQSACRELIGPGGGDTSALPGDPCGVISPAAFRAVFPDGVPVGEVTDDANSVCEYRSAEIGGPSVRVAIITPERVRSTAETARSDGSNPVTDLAGIGDEAYLIEGVRIFTNVDGTAGGGGTRGATLGVVAGDVGIWITSTDAAAIQQLGIAAVDDLG